MSLPVVFEFLFLTSAVLALCALHRQRPCGFIFAANQSLTLHSLQRFSESGRPDQLSYTPLWVYSPRHMGIAAEIFAIAVPMLAVCIFFPAPRKRLDPHSLPPVPAWLLSLCAVYFVLVAFSQRSMLSVQYAGDAQQVLDTPLGGVQYIVTSFVVYEVYRRVMVGRWSPGRGISLIVVLFLFTDVQKGWTGVAMGHILVTCMLLWGSRLSGRGTAVRVIAVLMVAASIAVLVRMVRISIHSEGLAAIENAKSQVLSDEQGEHAEEYTSGPSFATHVLDCIALTETGHSREWRSLTDPIIFTFQPSFLLATLDLRRPIDAPWELASYFVHMGGISVFGEAYWNGGFLGVFVFLGLILGLCTYCDSKYKSSLVSLVLLLNLAPVLLQGVNYGFAYEFRALVNGLLQLAVYRLVLPKMKQSSDSTPTLAEAPVPTTR